MFSRHIKGQTGANRRHFYIISCHNEHEIGHPKLLPEGLKRGSREYKKAGRQGVGAYFGGADFQGIESAFRRQRYRLKHHRFDKGDGAGKEPLQVLPDKPRNHKIL